MKHDFSNIFEDFFSHSLMATSNSYPPVNIFKDGDNVVLEMAVAGFKQPDLSVEFDGQRLVVSGKKEPVSSERRYITRELSARAFSRSFAISGQYEPLEPVLEDGVLTITLKGTNSKRILQIVGPPSTPLLST